jgi:hypothetical protein
MEKQTDVYHLLCEAQAFNTTLFIIALLKAGMTLNFLESMVNKEIKESKDALAKWEKSLLLQVLIRQLKDDMGESAYQNFIESSRKMLSPA